MSANDKYSAELRTRAARIFADTNRLHALTQYRCLHASDHDLLVTAKNTLCAILKDWEDGGQFERAHKEDAA